MKSNDAAILASVTAEGNPAAAFGVIVDELTSALAEMNIQFEAGPNGRVTQRGIELGRVEIWEPEKRIVLSWRQATWEPGKEAELEIASKPTGRGSQVTVEYRGLDALLGSADLTGWFARGMVAPLVQASTPESLGDWITDRRARRPSGVDARNIYRDPLYHYPNFRVILNELDLKPNDYLLEVGCGGGVLLKSAMGSGCRAAAVDHSPDMVTLARQVNGDAISSGKVKIIEADAERLPFEDDTFTCATMTGVFGFLQNPVAALSEIRRVLAKGGRLVLLGSDPGLRGTPAAPEPMASRLHFYDDNEFERIARSAGFGSVSIVRRDMEQYAREAGVPEEHLPLFKGPGGPFLVARKE